MRKAHVLLVPVLAVSLLAGCGGSNASTQHSNAKPAKSVPNRDPKKGSVVVWREPLRSGYEIVTLKHCDGPTLVYEVHGYQEAGIGLIPGSDACK